MINMIRADFYRIVKGRTLMSCLLLTVGWVFLCAYARMATISLRETLSGSEIVIDYWNSFFNYYPVVFPISIFCTCFASADFRQKTIKGYVSKGISKWTYYLSKLICCWLIVLLFLSVAFLVGIGCGRILFQVPLAEITSVWKFGIYLLCQWLFHASVITLEISVAFLVRNSLSDMAVNLSIVFFGTFLLFTIEDVLGMGDVLSFFWAYSNICKTTIGSAVQFCRLQLSAF